MARRTDVEKKLIGHYRAPRPNVLLVLHDEMKTETTTKGGLIVPADAALARVERVGTVISCGSKIQGVKTGDRVLMDKRLGITMRHEDEDSCRMVMVSQDQILAELDGEALNEDYDLVRDGLSL